MRPAATFSTAATGKNAADMVDHGRANGCGKLGSEHPKAKLTEEIVRQVRSEYAAGATELALAAKYGVNGVNHAPAAGPEDLAARRLVDDRAEREPLVMVLVFWP